MSFWSVLRNLNHIQDIKITSTSYFLFFFLSNFSFSMTLVTGSEVFLIHVIVCMTARDFISLPSIWKSAQGKKNRGDACNSAALFELCWRKSRGYFKRLAQLQEMYKGNNKEKVKCVAHVNRGAVQSILQPCKNPMCNPATLPSFKQFVDGPTGGDGTLVLLHTNDNC